MKVTMICEDFRPIVRGSLRGFAVIKIVDVAIPAHANGARWGVLAGRPQIQRDGQVIKKDGKVAYQPIMEITGVRDARDAFSRRMVEAVLQLDPHALDADSQSAA
jgi:hypothetical protein